MAARLGIAEIAAAVTILFLLGGRDVITVTPDFLKRKRQIFGIGFTREFFLHEVLNLRYRVPMRRRRPGCLVFDYEGGTLTLASEVTGAEAVELIERIRQKMRQYGAIKTAQVRA